MTVRYVTFTQTTAETLNGSDQLFVLSRITGSGLSAAITSTGNNNDIFIDGTVANANGRGVQIAGVSNNLTVSETGRILQASPLGGSAVFLNGGSGFNTVINNGQIIGNFALATGGTSNNNEIFNHGSILSTEDTSGIGGVTFYTDSNTLVNTGTVTGGFAGVVTRSGGNFNNFINEGTISGGLGVSNVGDGTDITNHGAIIGGSTGISSSGDGLELVNHGEITGETGLNITGDNLEIFNYGTLNGAVANAIFISGANNEISNFGTITGTISSFSATGPAILNEGLIDGDVSFLGANGDLYRANGTGSVTGEVSGGAGADTLIGAAMDDRLKGEGQSDYIRGRGGDDDLLGGGGNDTIFGNFGDDNIIGNNGVDQLMGGRGDDTVIGGGGNDIIRGGRGNDELRGGKDNDVFVFGRSTDNDTILDFVNGQDRIRISALEAANFTDLVDAGALYDNGASGSVLDLTVIGGDGLVTIETMSLGQWNGADFIF